MAKRKKSSKKRKIQIIPAKKNLRFLDPDKEVRMQEISGHRFIYTLLIVVAIVAIWRGLWGLMDIYLVADNRELSLWLSIIIGIAILLLSGRKLVDLLVGPEKVKRGGR